MAETATETCAEPKVYFKPGYLHADAQVEIFYEEHGGAPDLILVGGEISPTSNNSRTAHIWLDHPTPRIPVSTQRPSVSLLLSSFRWRDSPAPGHHVFSGLVLSARHWDDLWMVGLAHEEDGKDYHYPEVPPSLRSDPELWQAAENWPPHQIDKPRWARIESKPLTRYGYRFRTGDDINDIEPSWQWCDPISALNQIAHMGDEAELMVKVGNQPWRPYQDTAEEPTDD